MLSSFTFHHCICIYKTDDICTCSKCQNSLVSLVLIIWVLPTVIFPLAFVREYRVTGYQVFRGFQMLFDIRREEESMK